MNATTQENEFLASNNFNIVRPIVRGIEQLQRLRIQTGNRIAATYMRRWENSIADAKTKEEREKLQKQFDSVTNQLKKEYLRITDGLVLEGTDYIYAKLPKKKDFIPTPLISSYAELLLIDQYIRMINDEETNMAQLTGVLEEVPIYTKFLKHIKGVGPKMAGVIISEIDITKAKYVSSLWKLAGLDTVIYGYYLDGAGKEHAVHVDDILTWYADHGDEDTPMKVNGYEVKYKTKGRGMDKLSLIDRPYLNKDKEECFKKSITFNPYLKTKLVGVLLPSFLKSSALVVDGKRMGGAARAALAENAYGFVAKGTPKEQKDAVLNLLKDKGHAVEEQHSKYGKIYYDYRYRMEMKIAAGTMEKLTPSHLHARAARYAVKEFLRDLYVAWKHLAGLPIYAGYETAKLGYTHKHEHELFEQLGVDTSKVIIEPVSEDPFPAHLRAYINARNQEAAVIG